MKKKHKDDHLENEKQEGNEMPSSEESKQEKATMTASDLQLEQLKMAQKEALEFKEKYFLSLAELENMRKRLQKEKQEMTRFAAESILVEFLTPIDSFENALKFTENMSPEVKNWALGFNMLLTQFKDVLSNQGVTAFHSKGTLFDATLHEAVEAEETENAKEGIILEEFLCGYKKGDRVLRPARVKVAKQPNLENTN